MTLEERIAKLEKFMGDMDRITSVYANSLQEICDKYLSLLYIEVPVTETNILNVDGWLGDINNLPKNTLLNIRPSHNFKKYNGKNSTIVFKSGSLKVELPLRKYDSGNSNHLIDLEDGDYIEGIVYSVYINSQDIAVISANDTGNVALQLCAKLKEDIDSLNNSLGNLNTTINTQTITTNVSNITTANINKLNLTSKITLPTGSSCSTPTNGSEIANKSYVDNEISAKIKAYYDSHHIFGSGDANQALANAPEKSIYYRVK